MHNLTLNNAKAFGKANTKSLNFRWISKFKITRTLYMYMVSILRNIVTKTLQLHASGFIIQRGCVSTSFKRAFVFVIKPIYIWTSNEWDKQTCYLWLKIQIYSFLLNNRFLSFNSDASGRICLASCGDAITCREGNRDSVSVRETHENR